jgi:hypothetical protein
MLKFWFPEPCLKICHVLAETGDLLLKPRKSKVFWDWIYRIERTNVLRYPSRREKGQG